MNFTATEIQMLHDAIDMAIQSNKRMKNNKNPVFQPVIDQIITDLTNLKAKVTKQKQT